MILILFTTSYPYDVPSEQTFLNPEIPFLSKQIEKVIIVPSSQSGKSILPIPPGVEVNAQFAAFLKAGLRSGKWVKLVFLSDVIRAELRKNKTILLRPGKLLKLAVFTAKAELTRQWVLNLIKDRDVKPVNCILYSYWFNHIATGIGLLKRDFPEIKIISRAHEYDVYEEYHYPYYWPYRPETLKAMDGLFLVSYAGKQYYCDRYPEFIPKYETSYLGIADPGFVSKPSNDGNFRVVSCSSIIPIKRVDLLLEGLAQMARFRPAQKFEWIHFGDGKKRKALEARALKTLPSNIKARFAGFMKNSEIMEYYRDFPCDVFVNVSKSEGLPVSIQEAIGCGIPVVATDVGGNSEIVSKKNGILIQSDPTPEDIATALVQMLDNPSQTAEMRRQSRLMWQANFNADNNFNAFAQKIKALREK